jgi:hypothetical protein
MIQLLKKILSISLPIFYANAQEDCMTIEARTSLIKDVPGQLPIESRTISLRRGNKLETLIHSMGFGRGLPGSDYPIFTTIYKDLIVLVMDQRESMAAGNGNIYLYVFRQVKGTDQFGIQTTLPSYTLIKKTLVSDESEFTYNVLYSIDAECKYECKDDFLQIEVKGKKTFSKKISLKD